MKKMNHKNEIKSDEWKSLFEHQQAELIKINENFEEINKNLTQICKLLSDLGVRVYLKNTCFNK